MTFSFIRDSLTLSTIIPLFPLLLSQGIATRRKVPRIGEAQGPSMGTISGHGQPIRLTMIGESTVAGVCAKTYETSLAAQTAVFLNQSTQRPVEWCAIGKNGIRAKGVRELLLPKLHEKPDFIFIGLGVNDVTHFSTRQAWCTHLSGIFQDLHLGFGGIPIFMSGLPPMEQFPALPQPLRWYLGERAKIYDQLTQQLCQNFFHVTYLPLPKFEMAAFFCVDKFHPSELGYQEWGRFVATAVLNSELLSNRPALSV